MVRGSRYKSVSVNSSVNRSRETGSVRFMKIAQLAGTSGPRAVASKVDISSAADADLLDAFVSESKPSNPVPAPRIPVAPAALRHPGVTAAVKWIGVIAATIAATLGGLWAYQ